MSRNSSTRVRRRPTGIRWQVPLAALILVAGAAGCVGPPPEARLDVPGTYTANLWEPGGYNSARVLMCLDEASAVHLDSPPGTPGIGFIRLVWSDGIHEEKGLGGEAVELTTPEIPAGCGVLTFGVDCCHVDNFLTIEATKVG